MGLAFLCDFCGCWTRVGLIRTSCLLLSGTVRKTSCLCVFWFSLQSVSFRCQKTVRCAVKSGDCASNDSKRSKWPHLLAIKTENKFNYGKYFWLWVRVWFWRVLSTWTFMMNHLKLQHNQNKFNPQQFQFPIIRQQIYELRPSQQKINWIFN